MRLDSALLLVQLDSRKAHSEQNVLLSLTNSPIPSREYAQSLELSYFLITHVFFNYVKVSH